MRQLSPGKPGRGLQWGAEVGNATVLAETRWGHYLEQGLKFAPVERALEQAGWIEILVLAFVAGFVLFRLYTTLGRRTGAERPVEPQPAQGELPRQTQGIPPVTAPAAAAGAGEGLMAIVRADPAFEVEHFLSGARAAYELIVNAYAKGDRESLRGMLSPRVFDSYSAAIDKREEKDELGPELVRLRGAEIVDAELQGDKARVSVRFEAELAEGAHGVRDARERWTFERDIRSSDPNWLLTRVQAA